MTPQTRHISDAITLDAIQTDRFKTGVLTITFSMPQDPVRAAHHILLTGIMRRGTRRYPSLAAINRRLDELYATEVEIRSSKLGKNLLMTITAELLDDRYVRSQTDILAGVIDALSEIVLHPLYENDTFDEETVAQEIRCAIDALDAEINNTRAYAVTRCTEAMYRETPEFPTVKKIKDVLRHADGKTLYRHYCDLLSHASVNVFYIGGAPIDRVATLLGTSFAEYPQGARAGVIALSPSTPCAALALKEQMPVSQGKLAMGFRTGVSIATAPDYHKGLLLNELFGGSPASKLFLNVREKMSLCYYCSSSYSIYTGDMMVSSGIEVKNPARVRKAILSQFADIQQGRITEAEFEAAKRSLENCYRQIYDNPLDLSSFFGSRRFFGFGESVEDCRRAIAAVTREDVISLAQNVVCDTEFFIEGTIEDEEVDADES